MRSEFLNYPLREIVQSYSERPTYGLNMIRRRLDIAKTFPKLLALQIFDDVHHVVSAYRENKRTRCGTMQNTTVKDI